MDDLHNPPSHPHEFMTYHGSPQKSCPDASLLVKGSVAVTRKINSPGVHLDNVPTMAAFKIVEVDEAGGGGAGGAGNGGNLLGRTVEDSRSSLLEERGK